MLAAPNFDNMNNMDKLSRRSKAVARILDCARHDRGIIKHHKHSNHVMHLDCVVMVPALCLLCVSISQIP